MTNSRSAQMSTIVCPLSFLSPCSYFPRKYVHAAGAWHWMLIKFLGFAANVAEITPAAYYVIWQRTWSNISVGPYDNSMMLRLSPLKTKRGVQRLTIRFLTAGIYWCSFCLVRCYPSALSLLTLLYLMLMGCLLLIWCSFVDEPLAHFSTCPLTVFAADLFIVGDVRASVTFSFTFPVHVLPGK